MNTKGRFQAVKDALALFTEQTGIKARCRLVQAGCGQYSVDVFLNGSSSVAFSVYEVNGSFIASPDISLSGTERKALRLIYRKLRGNEPLHPE